MVKATKDPLAEFIETDEDKPLISAERRAEIEAEAMRIFEDEERKRQEDLILKKALARLRDRGNPESRNNDIVDITLDMAEHSDAIRINGVAYYHGMTYRVNRGLADTMRDIVYRGWRHQHEIDGKDLKHHYQAKREAKLSGKIDA